MNAAAHNGDRGNADLMKRNVIASRKESIYVQQVLDTGAFAGGRGHRPFHARDPDRQPAVSNSGMIDIDHSDDVRFHAEGLLDIVAGSQQSLFFAAEGHKDYGPF